MTTLAPMPSMDEPRAGIVAPSPLLSVEGLTVAYHHKPVLWEVHLTAPRGALVGIVGPNGAGKSTLIKACLGLVPRASGRVLFEGKPLEEQRRRVAYVPQRESVDWDFPVRVIDVVMMGLYREMGWLRWPNAGHRRRAMEALEMVAMHDFASRQISQLSGGQQQRVFLARALVEQAPLYFMDEPFAGVDAATERAIVEILRALRARGATVLAVHHDLQTVCDYYDRLVLINMRVVAEGPTEVVFTKENLARTYGGRLTLLTEATEALARARAGDGAG
jgi:manganese/zinc/iron transport system ATP- binding protein